MKVEKAKGVKGGYNLILTDEEYESLKPFLNRYDHHFMEKATIKETSKRMKT